MSWRYGKNTRCPLSLVAILKKSFFVLFNAMAESVNHFVFWKNLQQHLCNLISKKKTSSNTVKIYRNIYRKNLSAIIYRYRFKKLRFIDYRYRPGFFEVIDYRYRCSTKRLIVPITG